MSLRWQKLRESLRRSIQTDWAARLYGKAQERHPVLGDFKSPGALVDFLTGSSEERDRKDQLLRSLVLLVQEGPGAELGSALLWLGLWPGLDRVYRRRLRHFLPTPADLVSELGEGFTQIIAQLDLQSVSRVAATLVWSTDRQLLEGRTREWRLSAKIEYRARAPVPANDLSRHGREGVEGDAAPPSPGQALASLSDWLVSVAGADAELLLRVVVLDESQREVGTRLGLSHEAARKRYQRALVRLRKRLSDPGDGAAPPEGEALSRPVRLAASAL